MGRIRHILYDGKLRVDDEQQLTVGKDEREHRAIDESLFSNASMFNGFTESG